jgi:hypothetical protein
MFTSTTHFRSSLLVSLASLAACIGMRTPLDDASMPVGDSSDSTQAVCGSTVTIDTTPAPPDILILLDRSESMIWSLSADSVCAPGAANCSSRMDAVVPAVNSIMTDNPDIRWGLELFPTSAATNCSVSNAPQVAISSNSEPAIKSLLASITTSYSTPTAAAINAATAYLKKVSDVSNKAILLATDGLPNCASGQDWTNDDMTGATTAATSAKKAGFPLYVIGLGPSVGNLNSLAQAGGTGSYYPVTSTTQLNSALKAIAKVASLTCTFKANAIPLDKDLVTVYVDKSLVAKDDGNGWMFEPSDSTYSTIVLTGTYCQMMLAGATSQVQIVFGCPETASPDAMP